MKQLLGRSTPLPAPFREPRKARLTAKELRLRSGEKRLNLFFGAARTCRKHAAQLSGAVCPKSFLIFWAFVRTGERPCPSPACKGRHSAFCRSRAAPSGACKGQQSAGSTPSCSERFSSGAQGRAGREAACARAERRCGAPACARPSVSGELLRDRYRRCVRTHAQGRRRAERCAFRRAGQSRQRSVLRSRRTPLRCAGVCKAERIR